MEPETTDQQHSPTIDFNGFYPIRREGGQVVVDLSRATSPNFHRFMSKLTTLRRDDGREIVGTLDAEKMLRFEVGDATSGGFELRMQNQPIAACSFTADGIEKQPEHDMLRLTVSEVRALGMELHSKVLPRIPYDRALRQGFDAAKHSPITDLHTHSSAQVSPEFLMKAALEEDLKTPEETIEWSQRALHELRERRQYPAGPPAGLTQKGMDDLKPVIGIPVGLLNELAKLRGDDSLKVSDAQKENLVLTCSIKFDPTMAEGKDFEQPNGTCEAVRIKDLTDAQKTALMDQMRYMPDTTTSFSRFDREMYRYRNPLVKHYRLAKPMLYKIAEEYAEQGIQYAELSTGSMLDSKWLEEMTDAVKDIEENGVGPEHKPVTLRFLVGVPRTFGPEQIMVLMRRIKHLARHPYIVGCDWLGYEANKTKVFHPYLEDLARWATGPLEDDLAAGGAQWNFKEWFVNRVHAGETHKNPQNVSDAIAICEDYGFRTRIGHALNMDQGDRNLQHVAHPWLQMHNHMGVSSSPMDPKHDLFAFEMCPDSNQVYMSNPLVHDNPIAQRLQKAPCFLGSDGAGAVTSTPQQVALSALAAGATLQDLEMMRQHEENFLQRQRKRDTDKAMTFDAHYSGKGGMKAFIEEEKQIAGQLRGIGKEWLPPEFDGKSSVLIGGASKSSWLELDQKSQNEIERTMHLLVQTLDPKKVYFVLGRVKNEGVSKALDMAVHQYNRGKPLSEQFMVLGRYAGPQQLTEDLPSSMRWVHHISENIDMVPGNMAEYLNKKNGRALLFAGKDFTSEIAIECGPNFLDIPHAVMVPSRNVHGEREVDMGSKMGIMSQIIPEKLQFMTREGMLRDIFGTVGEGHFFTDEATRDAVLRAETVEKLRDPSGYEAMLSQADEAWQEANFAEGRRVASPAMRAI